MPRFVMLYHEMPPESDRETHWDLMLEDDGHLLTWAISQVPGQQSTKCKRLADHRLAYLDYEGSISNNRGIVSQYDKGEYEWVSRDNVWSVRLAGKKLCGTITLVELTHEDRDSEWSCQFVSNL